MSDYFCPYGNRLLQRQIQPGHGIHHIIDGLAVTGCLSAGEALAYFSNNNVIMIGGMCVVAAGFNPDPVLQQSGG